MYTLGLFAVLVQSGNAAFRNKVPVSFSHCILNDNLLKKKRNLWYYSKENSTTGRQHKFHFEKVGLLFGQIYLDRLYLKLKKPYSKKKLQQPTFCMLSLEHRSPYLLWLSLRWIFWTTALATLWRTDSSLKKIWISSNKLFCSVKNVWMLTSVSFSYLIVSFNYLIFRDETMKQPFFFKFILFNKNSIKYLTEDWLNKCVSNIWFGET